MYIIVYIAYMTFKGKLQIIKLYARIGGEKHWRHIK